MTDSHEAEVEPVAPVDIAIAEDVWGRGFEALRSRFSIAHVPTAWEDPDVLEALVGGARALVVRNRTALTRPVLLKAPRLEVVARAGTGTDNVDVLAADELGIVVVAATGANARSVAEHSLCLALALARDLEGHERRLRQGLWERPLGVELAGRTWGLVGLGATGGAVGRLARSIGMKVLGHDPYLSEEAEPIPGSQRVDDLLELAARSDIVSLHVPLTSESAGLIGRDFFEHMRSGSFLINVARGGVVDEQALADALDAGQLAGAALDVRPQEPPKPSRLDNHDRVILTPHVAGLTHEALEAVVTLLADDLSEVLGGSPASHAVGRWRAPKSRSRPPRAGDGQPK
jgi:D-3-phosphoglycerate dehydrogenase / 2-oxoglutarate reductase